MDPRHPGDAHREPLVIGHQLDDGFSIRLMPESSGYLFVNPLQRIEHHVHHDLIDARLETDDEVLGFHAAVPGQFLKKEVAIGCAFVEGIERDHGLQGVEGVGITPGL